MTMPLDPLRALLSQASQGPAVELASAALPSGPHYTGGQGGEMVPTPRHPTIPEQVAADTPISPMEISMPPDPFNMSRNGSVDTVQTTNATLAPRHEAAHDNQIGGPSVVASLEQMSGDPSSLPSMNDAPKANEPYVHVPGSRRVLPKKKPGLRGHNFMDYLDAILQSYMNDYYTDSPPPMNPLDPMEIPPQSFVNNPVFDSMYGDHMIPLLREVQDATREWETEQPRTRQDFEQFMQEGLYNKLLDRGHISDYAIEQLRLQFLGENQDKLY